MEHGLGRVVSRDSRDGNFLIQHRLAQVSTGPSRKYRYWWSNGWWGDQKNTPQCVAYSWLHWLEDGPITHSPRSPGSDPIIIPAEVYTSAQKIDEWQGEDYDGTSVRAGAKVLQSLGLIGTYRWAWDLDTAVNALLQLGPIVVGTTWYEEMFFPNEKNIIKVGGTAVGGHAYVINGINIETRMVRIKNSWGRSWGNKGYAYMSFDDLGNLIDDYGEVCIAEETSTR